MRVVRTEHHVSAGFGLSEHSKSDDGYSDITAKVLEVGQAKLTQAKIMLAETMKKHEADNHQGTLTKMVEVMMLITQARP